MADETPAPASLVLEHKPLVGRDTAKLFTHRLALETDCSDLYADLTSGAAEGFIVVDPRSPESYAQGHIPGAYNLPHRKIDRTALEGFPAGRVLILYGAGPGCNAAHKAAVRLGTFGLYVKEMIGGFWWWQSSGYPVATGPERGKIS
jgi:rhodanese-related sulfurtransferase